MSIDSVMPSNHLVLCYPFLLPSVFPSIRTCSSESDLCIRCPKYWSFSFSIRPSNEYSGLISFRIDWFDLLARDSQESLLAAQFENISSSVFSLVYGPTLTFKHDYWKNHSFDYMKLWQQVMSLLFNMLSRFVMAFLPKGKCRLISWLQSLSAVIISFVASSHNLYSHQMEKCTHKNVVQDQKNANLLKV